MNSGFSGNPFWRKWKKGCEPGWRAGSVVQGGVFLPPLSGVDLSALFHWHVLNLFFFILQIPAQATCFPRQAPGFSVFLYHSKTSFPAVPTFGTHLNLLLSSFFLCPDSGEGPCSSCRRSEGGVIIPKPLRANKPVPPQAKACPVQSKSFCLLWRPKVNGYQVSQRYVCTEAFQRKDFFF